MSNSSNMPEPGFYYHFKHDPSGPAWNYFYEVLGTAQHTEDATLLVIYRPLYDNNDHSSQMNQINKATSYARPLDMFMGQVRVGSNDQVQIVQRFTKVTDPLLIEKLKGGKRFQIQFKLK